MTLYASEEVRSARRKGILWASVGCVVLVTAVLGAVCCLPKMGPTASKPLPLSGDELFNPQVVHQIHLSFTAENWEAMEPKRNGGGGFGGPPGGGPGGREGGQPGEPRNREQNGNRNAGGPGGPGGGGFGGFSQDDFGVGMMLAPALMRGDADKDEKVSKEEILKVAGDWFTSWDTQKSGVLVEDDVKKGLDKVASQMMGGGPGGGPGGPGGGGPGGGGMFLARTEGARNGVAGMAGFVFEWVKADMEFDGVPLKDIAVRYKGNGTYMQSQNDLKRSMKLDLNDHVKGRSLGGATKINLHSCVTDASYMNEVLAHRLYRDAGVPAPRYSYAEVYLTVPGLHSNTYVGLYSIVENVDSNFTRDYFGTQKGVVFKPVAGSLMEYISDKWSDYAALYDPKMPVLEEDSNWVINFCKLVSQADDSTFNAQVENYLNLDEFARFMGITTWISTMDSLLVQNQNFLVYLHPKTRQLQFMPWDLDHAFGQFGMFGSQDARDNLSIRKPWSGNKRFLERVFNVPKFKQLYQAHLEEFNQTICTPQRLSAQVDEVAKLIRDSVAKESEVKLTRFDQAVAGETPTGGFGGFGGPPPNQGNNNNREFPGGPGGGMQPPQGMGMPPQGGPGGGMQPPQGMGMPPQGGPGGGMQPPQGMGMPPQGGPGGGMQPPQGMGMPPQGGPGGGMQPPQGMGMPPQGGPGGGMQPPSMRGEGQPGMAGEAGSRQPGANARNNERRGNRGGGGFPGGPGFGGGAQPIKAFAKVRWQSVADQLAGKSEGVEAGGGFGPGGGDRGGRSGFGPGNFMGGALFSAMDTEKTQKVNRDVFLKSFETWFEKSDTQKAGALSESELRRGLNKCIRMEMPRLGGPPGGGPGEEMPPPGV